MEAVLFELFAISLGEFGLGRAGKFSRAKSNDNSPLTVAEKSVFEVGLSLVGFGGATSLTRRSRRR